MDRELGVDEVARRARRRYAAVTAGVVALAALVVAPRFVVPTLEASRVRTARVERGDVDAVLTATGTVVPEREQVISSPLDVRLLRVVRRAGEAVKSGEPLLELDLSAARASVAALERQVALKDNARRQAQLALDASLADLRGRRDIKRLQLESLQAAHARARELSAAGLVSRESLAQAALAESQAAIELRQIEEGEQQAKASADAQREGLALEMATVRGDRDEARRQVELATARAPRDGVVTWVASDEGATVHRGDVLARVADLTAFRVDATVSDAYVRALQPGLPVTVKVGDEVLAGTIDHVDPTVKAGLVTAAVRLSHPASPLLRPNLRVDVLVSIAHRAGVLRVDRGAGIGGSGVQPLFVVQGARARRRSVRIGVVGLDHVEIEDGLGEGETVVVSDMGDAASAQEVRIR